MKSVPLPRTRKLSIIAQDPSILGANGKILTTQIDVPAEELAPGPRGHRVHVIDYDTTTATLYKPQQYDDQPEETGTYDDPFLEIIERGDVETLLEEPGFHAQNVYAIIMRVLARFEFALGRRIGWGFAGHQIYAAPHAFADANAFYSEQDQALAFGYFRSSKGNAKSKPIFTCLSHDVVAHETTHAILDGLRERYTAPSTPEQAGFHEGFADTVALLSIFSLRDVVSSLLLNSDMTGQPGLSENYVPVDMLNRTTLQNSVLLGMAEQMGEEVSGIRGNALRRSVELQPLTDPNDSYLKRAAFEEPHRCGELVVAAIMNAFLELWLTRLKRYIEDRTEVDVSIVVDEGASAADHLLTMAIRALDYMPPTDIRIRDYLSALLTSDRETVPDDSRYQYRRTLRDSFRAYGIKPATPDDGYWTPVDAGFTYDRTHFDSLLSDPNEIFRFIWDNRDLLELEPKNDVSGSAYMKVQSVRPCMRIGPDGFVVRETVAEYVQMTTLRWDELYQAGITDMKLVLPDETEITLYGSGTLIFDEYGKLKYHIHNRIFSNSNQPRRIEFLWKYGYLGNAAFTNNIFSRMHINRLLTQQSTCTEGF